MPFPRLLPVRQRFENRAIGDVAGEARARLVASGLASRLKPGAKVALGVGSRGIANIAIITRAVADYWKSNGCHPFIFPAMGSHGAATAEGQADVLAHLGIHEASMGCPVISSLDVVSVGATADGIEAFMDRQAFESDGVMLIARVKWHTDFSGKIESGLLKMMAIGLGKFAGAQRYHIYAYKPGLEHVIRSVGRQMLKSGKMLGGVAILEDANHNTGRIDVVRAEDMERVEEELLALVKTWMGHIPLSLDVLIVDEIGKNISGAGMDTKVVNRSVYGESNPWPAEARFERIFVRDLSAHSYGNAMGIGLADVIHDRMIGKIDWNATRINSLTACTPAMIRTPMHFSTDRECLERIAATVEKVNLLEITFGRIRNSMELGFLKISENLRSQIEKDPTLEVVGPAEEMEFDEARDLEGWTVEKEPVATAT